MTSRPRTTAAASAATAHRRPAPPTPPPAVEEDSGAVAQLPSADTASAELAHATTSRSAELDGGRGPLPPTRGPGPPVDSCKDPAISYESGQNERVDQNRSDS